MDGNTAQGHKEPEFIRSPEAERQREAPAWGSEGVKSARARDEERESGGGLGRQRWEEGEGEASAIAGSQMRFLGKRSGAHGWMRFTIIIFFTFCNLIYFAPLFRPSVVMMDGMRFHIIRVMITMHVLLDH